MAKRVTTITPLPPTAPKPKRVAAYARVSSGKDAMLHSLSAQVSYFSSYIQSHPGWIYAGTYADEAYTGTKNDRPEFQRMLKDCREGKIDKIITKSVSRFARNTLTTLETVRELRDIGVSVYFEEHRIDTMAENGEVLLTILASCAQAESLSVSENCKWRIRHDFENGKPVNLMFIYGYCSYNGKIAIDPEKAAVVRRIFSDYIRGIGTPTIAAQLREEGVPTMLGGEWRANHVREILRNEKYTGGAIMQKTYTQNHLTKKTLVNRGRLPKQYAEGTHPAIIDRETYETAQRIMDARWANMALNNPTAARYPFTGKIVCGNCGKHFKRKTTHGRISWQCGTYLIKGKSFCPAKQIPEETLLSITASVLGLSVFDKGVFEKKVERIIISAHNELTFILRDGREDKRIWKDRSRAESWTDEMRQAAANNAKKRRQHE